MKVTMTGKGAFRANGDASPPGRSALARSSKAPGQLVHASFWKNASQRRAGSALPSTDETRRMHDELDVYKIVLEMQNEELRRAQIALEASRARYFDLYNLAPVGYCTLSEDGLILETNLATAKLLNLTRDALLKRALSLFIVREDQASFHELLERLFAVDQAQAGDLRMLKHGGAPILAHLEASVARDDDGAPVCHMVLSENPELQRVHEEMRGARKLLDKVETLSKIGGWKYDVATGLSAWTDGVYRIFGIARDYQGDDVKNPINYFSPGDREIISSAFQTTLDERQPFDLELEFVRPDGMHRWVRTTGHPETGNGELVSVTGCISDITDRKRIELEREQYLNFFLLTNEAMCITEPFGAFLRVNPAFTRLTGLEASELMSKPFLEFILPEDRQKTREEIKLQVEVRQSLNFENRFVGKDGRVILLSWNAYFDKNDGVSYATVRDITNIRRTELEVVKAGERFRSLFALISDAILISDMDGRFIEVNPAACESLGYRREEMLRMGPADINTPESAARIPEVMKELLKDGGGLFEATHLRKDGVAFPVQLNARVIDFDNKPALAVVARDISAHKQAEEHLRAVAATLEQQVVARTSRLRAVSAQLAMTEERERRALAQELHDNLSQLLAVIKIKLTSMTKAPSRSSIDTVVTLVDQAEKSARLITRELSPQILQTLGFIPALISLAKDNKHMFDLTVHVDCDRAPESFEAGMRALLYRSVRELLVNIGKHARVSEAYLVCRIAEDRLRIILRDNGCGFEPVNFHDSPVEIDGFGLRSIYERMTNIGGEMTIESSPGHGTTITLSVPYAVGGAEGLSW